MIKNKYIEDFYEEVCQNLEGIYKIVIEPGRDINKSWIEIDSVKWEIEDEMKPLVENLKKNNKLTLEEKIMELYKFICVNYIYDVNVLYFFRKDRTDPENVKHIACDWYGRIIGNDWIENRKKHNRRICYEFARSYAKAINELIDNKYDLEAVIVGDIDNLHYVVGLTGRDYSLILDQDDFNSIKDLTRLKLNLTLKGIHIFRDEEQKFTKLIKEYNQDKLEELKDIDNARKLFEDNKINIIEYLKTAIKSLEEYKLDPQGYFEYIRALTESAGIEIEKVWKIDTRKISEERRHERCFYFECAEQTYLFDSIERTLEPIDIEKLDKKIFIFTPEENEYEYLGG